MSAPKGFKKVETGMAGFWKPTKKGQCLQGVVGSATETTGADNKPNTYFRVTLTVAECGGLANSDGRPFKGRVGMVIGVGGAVLKDFMRNREGHEVYLEYSGLGKAKRGHNAPKLFDCYDSNEAAQ